GIPNRLTPFVCEVQGDGDDKDAVRVVTVNPPVSQKPAKDIPIRPREAGHQYGGGYRGLPGAHCRTLKKWGVSAAEPPAHAPSAHARRKENDAGSLGNRGWRRRLAVWRPLRVVRERSEAIDVDVRAQCVGALGWRLRT